MKNGWRVNVGAGTLVSALALAAIGRAEGAAVAVGVPSPSARVDTERVTNIAFDAGCSTDRQFNLSLALNASASNAVVVAFGRDDDADGELGWGERDILVGWEAGTWVLRDRRAGTAARISRSEGMRRLDFSLALTPRRESKSLMATDEEGVVFAGSAARTLFDPGWNMLRITTCGLVDPNGLVVSEVRGWGFKVILR